MIKDWRDTLQVGDVLLTKSGSPRIVRKVSYRSNGFLGGVRFTIKKCSWTKLCYTCVGRTDLDYRKFKKSNLRVRELRSLLDVEIAEEIKFNHRKLSCKSVRGIC